MISIESFDGIRKDILEEFEKEQWPIADKKHFGDEMPDFTKKHYTILAKENSQIVGFIKMEIDMGVATVSSLLVHDNTQRKGVGSALLQKAEDIAQQESSHVITLQTGESWDAKNFYEAQGYKVTAKLHHYYGKQDFVFMEKRLGTDTNS